MCKMMAMGLTTVKLTSPHRNFYGFWLPLWYLQTLLPMVTNMTYLTVTEYLWHMWSRICSVCHNHNPISSHSWWWPHVEQELLARPEHLNSLSIFNDVRVGRSLLFSVMLCRSLFVLLSFFLWPLHCQSFFNLRLLNTKFGRFKVFQSPVL
jgi:hypothetical protein